MEEEEGGFLCPARPGGHPGAHCWPGGRSRAAQSPCPAGASQSPCPAGTSQAPCSAGSSQAQAPCPASASQAPCPAGADQAHCPASSTQAQAPCPASASQAPCPAGSAQTLCPAGACACVFVLCEHMAFVLVFCVPCALMSIVLTPPILLPDYWLICPTCVYLVTLLICSLYNLLVFAVPCQFVVDVTLVVSCPALPCLALSCQACQLSCFSPTG